jgi:hypothetical protein
MKTDPIVTANPAGRRHGHMTALVMACAIAVLALPFVLSPSVAGVYYVDTARPDDSGDGTTWAAAKKTVQAGIDAGGAGDTVLVKHGTYSISMACSLTTDRKITSDDGTHDSWDTAVPDSSQCTIEAQSTSRVFTIKGPAVTAATQIRGLKMKNGIATGEGDPSNAYGGGIHVAEGASAIIENCWVTDNTAGTDYNGYGGGVACSDAGSSLIIRYCRITYNIGSTVWLAFGGGIYYGSGTSGEIYGSTISYNVAASNRHGYGGAIHCTGADVDIRSNTISYNAGAGPGAGVGKGGGIYAEGGTVGIWDNVVTDNVGAQDTGDGGDGGGIWCAGTEIHVHDNPEISRNVASAAGNGNGGGIYTSNALIERNVITNNSATSSSGPASEGHGGGLHCPGNDTVVRENVIADNVASVHGLGSGGGLYFHSGSYIERNIVAFNVASGNSEGNGGGAWSYNASYAELINNTFYRNATSDGISGSGLGSGYYHHNGGTPDVVNNIFVNHDIANSDMVGVHANVAITITNNCFHNNPDGDYNANVTSLNEPGSDPRLTDPDGGDFTLLYDSPCIEAGDASYPCPQNGGWVVDIGAKEYSGTRHQRTIAGPGEYLFGGRVKAKVNLTTAGSVTDIDMTVHPGERHPMAGIGVMRWHEITATGGGATFDLTLSYNQDELNLVDETDLYAWRWTGSLWDGPKAPSATSASENWITIAGETAFSDWMITGVWGPTAVGDDDVPMRTELSPNYPNPFNPMTTIAYSLERRSRVRLAVYDVLGRLVRVLEDTTQPAGFYSSFWDGRDRSGAEAASGVYLLELRAGDVTQVRKLVLVR